jgi:hypothetical protein
MPRWCEHIDMPMKDGKVAHRIVCHSGPDPRTRCSVCGRKGADRLCDWLIGNGKTCDKPLCRHCAGHPVPVFGKPETADIDYCPEHYALYRGQSFEIKKGRSV